VLQWARANGCSWNEDTCASAAAGGHLEVLKWARANGCPWNALTCFDAAAGGHLEVLQWARANGYSAISPILFLMAASGIKVCVPAQLPKTSCMCCSRLVNKF
jgi:hypothetical protein